MSNKAIFITHSERVQNKGFVIFKTLCYYSQFLLLYS
jgi:hypothetical protein